MKRYQTWRYKCDFCGKANCSGGAIAKHELHCTKNPNRACRMCAAVGDKQAPMADLIAAIKYGESDELGFRSTFRKIDALRSVAHNCPACILAALRQINEDKNDPILGDDGFNWKLESKAWIEDYRNALVEYGDEERRFDREEWDLFRAKRLPQTTIATP